MSRMELELDPQSEWNEEALADWSCALTAFFAESGYEGQPKIRVLPGYQILTFGNLEKSGEIILSASERIVLLEGWSILGETERELASFIIRCARQMGAKALCISICSEVDRLFWVQRGGKLQPDPIPLDGDVFRERVAIHNQSKQSLLITYDEQPVLCLEPVICNAHAPGPISFAQRRLEKEFGGQPLGFASRVAVHSPWEINKEQWDDLLAYTRLQAFELISEGIFDS